MSSCFQEESSLSTTEEAQLLLWVSGCFFNSGICSDKQLCTLTGVKSLVRPNGPIYPQILFQLARRRQPKGVHYSPQHVSNSAASEVRLREEQGGGSWLLLSPVWLWGDHFALRRADSHSKSCRALQHTNHLTFPSKRTVIFRARVVKDGASSRSIFTVVHYVSAPVGILYMVECLSSNRKYDLPTHGRRWAC